MTGHNPLAKYILQGVRTTPKLAKRLLRFHNSDEGPRDTKSDRETDEGTDYGRR